MTNPTAPELVVNVRELLRSPGARKHVDLTWAPAEAVGTPVAAVAPGSQVQLAADIDHVVEGLLVSGTVRAAMACSCVRCLTEFSDAVAVDVRELFALDPAEAEDDGYAVAGDQLPLETMVRDALVLALPAAPLHAPDCAGLCPTCGADRNTIDCGHDQAPVDQRWAALAELQHPDPT